MDDTDTVGTALKLKSVSDRNLMPQTLQIKISVNDIDAFREGSQISLNFFLK